jgi:hypothetical protein
MLRHEASRKAFRKSSSPLNTFQIQVVGPKIASGIVHRGYVTGRFWWPALISCFNSPKIENALTRGGRKYVSRFDDDASSTYTEYLCDRCGQS